MSDINLDDFCANNPISFFNIIANSIFCAKIQVKKGDFFLKSFWREIQMCENNRIIFLRKNGKNALFS